MESLYERKDNLYMSPYIGSQKPKHMPHRLLHRKSKIARNLRTARESEPFICRTARFKKFPINYGLFKY